MASQISPGIILKERDITTATIVGAQALTAAFAAPFAKGPVDLITPINSQREFLDTFGLPNEGNAEDWFVASEFLNYGGRLGVVRVLTDGLGTANSDGNAGFLVKNDTDWLGNSYSVTFAARTPGKWGNSSKVVVIDRGADQYVTLAAAPDTASTTPGSVWEFSNGNSGYVLSWDAATKKAAIILEDPENEISAGDILSDGDELNTFTTDAATESARTPGTYTPDPDAKGAAFQVVVGSATGTDGEISGFGFGAGTTVAGQEDAVYTPVGDGTAAFTVTRDGTGAILDVVLVDGGTGYDVTDTITILGSTIGGADGTDDVTVTVTELVTFTVGGSVTVTKTASGAGYSVGETITLAGADVGGGSDIEVTVVSLDPNVDVTAVQDWYTNTSISVGATTIPLISFGQRPGTSQYATDRGIGYDEVTVAIVDIDGKISGTVANVIETFSSLSKLSDGRSTENANVYFKTVINDQSSYVFNGTDVIDVVAGTGEAWSVDSETLTTGDVFARCGVQVFDLTAGADNYAYNASEIVDAYDNFTSTEQVFVDFVLMGGSMSDENDTKTKANKIISLATARKDCIAFVSPHKGNQIGTNGPLTARQQKEQTIAFFKNFQSSSYAVFDSGYKYIYDRFNDRYRYIPCNGDVAGLCVSTSATLEDWYSPAGVSRGSLRNAIKLAYTPSKSDRDELYVARINPITSLPGTGITLFGDKTALSSTSAFDRINVRRLFLNIEKRVERLASGVLFEQNDILTRSSFASAVNSYLSEVQAKRGVTDFLVVCDETNNTPDVIDRNEFVAEIFVKPTRSINYISITFTAAKTGVAFSEVVGR